MSSVCPSVRLSVTLVDCDHMGWNSSEIISPLVSLGCSLSADPNIRGIFQREQPEILAQSYPPSVDLSITDIRSQIAPAAIFENFEWPYLRNGWSNTLHVWFSGRVFRVGGRMALFPVTSNPSWRQAAILDNFEWPYLRNGSFDPLI